MTALTFAKELTLTAVEYSQFMLEELYRVWPTSAPVA